MSAMSASRSRLAARHDEITVWLADGKNGTEIAALLGVDATVARRYIKRYCRGEQQAAAPTRKLTDAVDQLDIVTAERDELRAALRKDRKTAVADERIVNAFLSAVASQPQRELPISPHRPLRTGNHAHHRALLMLSDFHGGEVVDREVINGLNTYDWEIMEARVEQLLRGVEKHIKRMPALTGLDVGLLGDMCSGANHEEIKETNQYGMADQAVKMAYLQAEILGRLANLVPDLKVFAVEGNHPRLEHKPAAKNPHNNMDWVAAMFTREMVKQLPNLSAFEIGRGSLIWEIAGRKAYVFHGDGIKSSMPGVPWGGIMRRTNTLSTSYPFTIHHYLFGHWHQANVVQGGRIIGNGSLKGCDEWTLKNFGGGEHPCQLLLNFDERAERLTDVRYLTPTAGL